MKKRKKEFIIQEIIDITDFERDNDEIRDPLDLLIEREERELPEKTMKQIIKEVGGTI